MATITTRAGKGSPLSNSEVDDNFTNLNTDKLETSGGTISGDLDITGELELSSVSRSTANAITASGASTTVDMSASNFHVVTMNATTTFSFSNLSSAVTASGTIIIKQDATGGRTFTLPSECKTPVGGASIVQSTGASTTSILSYIVVSASEVLVNYVGDFA